MSQLDDFDPTFTVVTEYSYGTNKLAIKANHSFLFKRETEEAGKEHSNEEKAVGLICIFDNDPSWGLNKISLKDEPEIWAFVLEAKNGKEEQFIAKHVADILLKVNFYSYDPGDLRTAGTVYRYHWKSDDSKKDSVEWTGKVIGYPLVEIFDSDQIREKILKKLFDKADN
jgi:hypothetical protein